MEQQKAWDSFYKIVGGEVQLKTLRQVVIYLLSLIEKPASTSKDLSQVIKLDSAISTRVLTIVNSPAFGLRQKILDLSHAITYLGFEQVRDIILNVSILEKTGKKQERDFIRLWKHSLLCGKISELIARSIGSLSGEAFTVGLLHDIGKIILSYSNPAAFSKAQQNYIDHKGKISPWQAEKELFGISHAEIGGLAVVYWKLPEVIYHVVWGHHAPRTGNLTKPEEVLSQIVYAADLLSWALGYPSINNINPYLDKKPEEWVKENYLIPLGLTQGKFQDIVTRAKETIKQTDAIFTSLESGIKEP